MTLLIRKPGILSTIQDLGRTGARRFGVNPGGVMDTAATRVVNVMLGNHERAAVLEMHFPAAEIEFEADTVLAIGGADFSAEVDGNACRNWTLAPASRGQVLKFRGKRSGQRAYLAVAGGFAADEWIGSSSTNLAAGLGGLDGRIIRSGDRLLCGASTEDIYHFTAGNSLMGRGREFSTIRIIAGPEFEYLTAISEQAFLDGTFKLSTDCDRMGYRLAGEPLHLLNASERVSSAVTFGTIQLLPDGQMVVLMADHQTSGGYPRIGNVISADLPILAQCGPGNGVQFELVSIEEAERLALRFERELNFLRVGCRLQTQNAND